MIARGDKAQARKSIIASLAIGAMLMGAAMALSPGSVASQNLAVAQEQTGNATTISNTTATDTFMAKGVIGGTVSESGSAGNQTATAGSNSSGNATSAAGNQTQTASSSSNQFIAAGDWMMDVNGGNVTDFRANFTVVRTDATEHHSHDITNFKLGNNTNVQLDPTGQTSVNGSADIMTNGTTQWPGVDTTVTIDKAIVLTIQPMEEAGQHFGGQPIYGIVTSITGENGTQIAESVPAGGNQTQQEDGDGGGILDPLTEPFEDLFGGGQ